MEVKSPKARSVFPLFLIAFAATASNGFARDAEIRAIFNQDARSRFQDPYRGIEREGRDFEKEILEELSSAKKSIWIAIQEFRLPGLASELVRRKKAGIDVRVVLENQYSFSYSSLTADQIAKLNEHARGSYEDFAAFSDANQDGTVTPEEFNAHDAVAILRAGGVPVIDDTSDGSKGSGLMHHKFILIDAEKVIVTSANFTLSDFFGDFKKPQSRGNPNALLHIDSQQTARAFVSEFEILWGHRYGLKKPHRGRIPIADLGAMLQFSPTSKTKPYESSTNGLIESELKRAQTSVDLNLFVFSEQRLADALIRPVNRPLTIRALIEPDFAYRYYSEMLDFWGIAMRDPKCRIEAGNRPWKPDVKMAGIAHLPYGDRMHHKFAVLDGRKVVFGSHNWSDAANRLNDEFLFVIDSPQLAQEFTRETVRLHQDSQYGPPGWLMRKIDDLEEKCAPKR